MRYSRIFWAALQLATLPKVGKKPDHERKRLFQRCVSEPKHKKMVKHQWKLIEKNWEKNHPHKRFSWIFLNFLLWNRERSASADVLRELQPDSLVLPRVLNFLLFFIFEKSFLACFFFFFDLCEGSFRSPYARWFLSLGYWVDKSGEKNTPLRDRDHLKSDPHEFPGFLN